MSSFLKTTDNDMPSAALQKLNNYTYVRFVFPFFFYFNQIDGEQRCVCAIVKTLRVTKFRNTSWTIKPILYAERLNRYIELQKFSNDKNE